MVQKFLSNYFIAWTNKIFHAYKILVSLDVYIVQHKNAFKSLFSASKYNKAKCVFFFPFTSSK